MCLDKKEKEGFRKGSIEHLEDKVRILIISHTTRLRAWSWLENGIGRRCNSYSS